MKLIAESGDVFIYSLSDGMGFVFGDVAYRHFGVIWIEKREFGDNAIKYQDLG